MLHPGQSQSRALFVMVALSGAIVGGGVLTQYGLIAARTRPAAGAQLFDQVFARVQRDYVDTLPDSALYRRAAAGSVEELGDPHSVYLDANRRARLAEATTGRYAGVGVQIDVRDGAITVVAPLAGGPAAEAGIRPGDRITEIDGRSTIGLTPDEAQKGLRGDPGTRTRLLIVRPAMAEPIPISLVRRQILVTSVQHPVLLRGSVGYVDLTVFSDHTASDLCRAVDSLRGAGMHALVLDLRGDPGGLLDQGVAVADLFLDPGQRIVSMRGRTRDADQTIVDRTPQPWPGLELAVLVDSNTASAAEIVAGALQDHDRAVIIGSTTYGKGSAQSLFPLIDGGALKLTTARWFTPSGRSIDKIRAGQGLDTGMLTAAPTQRYRTDAGRPVRGGGGISPDLPVAARPPSAAQLSFDAALGRQVSAFQDALTASALELKATRGVSSPTFAVTPAMRAELYRQLRLRGVLLGAAVFDADSEFVDRALGLEIARYVFDRDAEFMRRLGDDPVVAAAIPLMVAARSERDALQRAAGAAR